MEWLPIETAPIQPFVQEKWYVDGPRFLLWNGGWPTIGAYGYTERGKGRWKCHMLNCNIQPTHWMPLPQPPKAQS